MTTDARGSSTVCEAVESVAVCRLGQIEVEGGVVALVHGEAVAVFRTQRDEVYALANYDPCSGASVLSRGIVGSRGEVPVVASPMHKQSFDLRTGRCLDLPEGTEMSVPTFEVWIDSPDIVTVGRRRPEDRKP